MKGKLAIVALLLMVAFSVPAFAGPFSDVPETHWAYEAIVKMQEKGIIEGFQGQYKGKQPITRYEAAVIIARVIEAVEKSTGKYVGPITTKDGTKVDLSGLTSKEDFDAFKATVDKLAAEFKDELAALGVRVSAVEEKTKALQEDVNKLKKFQWSGSIRTRVWDAAGSWGDLFKKDRTNGNTGADTFTKLNLNVAVNETTNAKVALYHRNWNCGSLGNSGWSNAFCQGWTDEGGSKEALTVNEAYVQTEGFGATWTIGRQHYQFGPYGVLVKSKYGPYAVGAAKVEKDMGGVKLTGIVVPVGDKYAALRGAIPVGKEGDELGVNVLALGPGAIRSSFGADLKMSIFKAEIASLAWDSKVSNNRALGIVVGADVVNNEKWSLNVKAASFDGQSGDKAAFSVSNGSTYGTYSLMGWEDVEGVFRTGFKGVGVTGTYQVNEDWKLSGEVNKGNSKSPSGFGKLTLSTTFSPNVDAAFTLVQVGKNANSRAVAIRGELSVKF